LLIKIHGQALFKGLAGCGKNPAVLSLYEGQTLNFKTTL